MTLADPGMGGLGGRPSLGLVVAARSSVPRTRGRAILETICDLVIDYECAHFSLNHVIYIVKLRPFCI